MRGDLPGTNPRRFLQQGREFFSSFTQLNSASSNWSAVGLRGLSKQSHSYQVLRQSRSERFLYLDRSVFVTVFICGRFEFELSDAAILGVDVAALPEIRGLI